MTATATTGPKYQEVNGFKFNPCFPNIADALTYEARPDDLFIVTYPKCGTTWTQHIVTLILNDGEMPEAAAVSGNIFTVSPFLELNGKQAAIDAKRPCAIKTHLPYHLQPKHPDAKYIIVLRNPKDACVSFYYHQTMFPEYQIMDMDFHDFFPFWLTGEVDCGDYFDFVLSWWKERSDPHVLMLLYEEMKADAAGSVLKVAKFINSDYADRLSANNNEILNKVIEKSSFNRIKESANAAWFPVLAESGIKKEDIRFVRKGIVGDWKNHMTNEENEMLEAVFHQKLDGSGLENMWHPYGIFR